MAKRNRDSQLLYDETVELKNRLQETEETLRAIRQYMVDAFVITRQDGIEVVTLADAGFPYRLMVESMNEGAVTLIPDGTIFYCNSRFSEMVRAASEKLIGVRFADLLPAEQHEHFQAMLLKAEQKGVRGEFCLRRGKDTCVPVQLSFYRLEAEDMHGIAILATDITERVQAEEKIRALASELTIAEQEERQRISQILHDDLQQRLFAMRAQLSFVLETFQSDTAPADLGDAMDQLQSWLTEAITVTRNLSVDISPVVLQGDGIEEAIHWLSARMKEQHGLQVETDVKDDFEGVPVSIRVTIFQTVRELLFNIVKHAGTLHANVLVERLDKQGCITITDTGTGFEAQTVLRDSHMAHGLLIIRDRLKLMGGTLQIESTPGNGTRARIEFPLENTSA